MPRDLGREVWPRSSPLQLLLLLICLLCALPPSVSFLFPSCPFFHYRHCPLPLSSSSQPLPVSPSLPIILPPPSLLLSTLLFPAYKLLQLLDKNSSGSGQARPGARWSLSGQGGATGWARGVRLSSPERQGRWWWGAFWTPQLACSVRPAPPTPRI